MLIYIISMYDHLIHTLHLEKKFHQKVCEVDYDDTSKVLEGAIFRVAVKQEDTYRTVIKKHLTYAVISNEKGEFTVEGLPKGTYYLIETKAPRGIPSAS